MHCIPMHLCLSEQMYTAKTTIIHNNYYQLLQLVVTVSLMTYTHRTFCIQQRHTRPSGGLWSKSMLLLIMANPCYIRVSSD